MVRGLQRFLTLDRRRCRTVAVALWAILALPLLGFPMEALPVCTMACSVDADSCCCRALGRIAPFSVTGEASYLSSHLPSAPKAPCLAMAVLADAQTLSSPDQDDAIDVALAPVAETLPTRPFVVVGEAELSLRLLPRPPPSRL